MEKKIPCKQYLEESQSIYTNIKQNKLKEKIVSSDREEHFMMIKGTIHQEAIPCDNYNNVTSEPQNT